MMLLSEEEFYAEVLKEICAFKFQLSTEHKAKLDFSKFEGESSNFCLYGLAFGHAYNHVACTFKRTAGVQYSLDWEIDLRLTGYPYREWINSDPEVSNYKSDGVTPLEVYMIAALDKHMQMVFDFIHGKSFQLPSHFDKVLPKYMYNKCKK